VLSFYCLLILIFRSLLTVIRELHCSASLNDTKDLAALKPSVVSKKALQTNCIMTVQGMETCKEKNCLVMLSWCGSVKLERHHFGHCFNPLTPNDDYSGRTAPLTSKRCILYIYSTNIGTEYLKHGI